MKNLLIVIIVAINGLLFSQEQSETISFSNYEFGFLGGINLTTNSDIGSSFIFEGKTNLSSHLNLKLSVGYSKLYFSDTYNIKTYDFVSINNIEKYFAISYDVIKKEYQIIPLSIGLQHFFNQNILSSYYLIEFGYNLIDPNIIKSQTSPIGEFDSFDQLPNDYKNKHEEILPNGSYSIGFGLGITYKLSSIFYLDLRYLYKTDSEKINNHQILIGFNF